jgi:hypothetical protein
MICTICFLARVLDSIHGGNYRRHEGITPLDQQDQLFAKAIKFPVEESNAWTEKVWVSAPFYIYNRGSSYILLVINDTYYVCFR